MTKMRAQAISRAVGKILDYYEIVPKDDIALLRKYEKYLNKLWTTESKLSVNEMAEAILKLENITPTDIDAMLEKMRERMSDIVDKKKSPVPAKTVFGLIKRTYTEQQKEAFRKAGKAPREFNMVDKRAIRALYDHDLYWIGNHYNRHVRSTVRDMTIEAFREGLGRKDLAKKLKKELGGYLGGKKVSKNYWDVVASSSMVRSRTISAIVTYNRLRIKYYQWHASGDERMCPICGYLDGLTWPATRGMEQVEKLITAQTPDEVKDIAPWYRLRDFRNLTTADIQGIAFLPPAHGLCRCELLPSDTATTVEMSPADFIDEFYQKNLEKFDKIGLHVSVCKCHSTSILH